jgi:drug/metabolite transporter (DMT)-like permease
MSGLATKHWSDGNLAGNVLILSGVVCCAFYTVLARRVGQEVEPVFAAAFQQTFALGARAAAV